MTDKNRIDREKEFHNEAFSSGKRGKIKKYYSTNFQSKQFYRDIVNEDVDGVKALEFGCGPGSQAFTLAQKGADVYAIDISDVAIEQARGKAKEQGVKINFAVMNAENLGFDDDTFDLVCGSGILHHLDLERCFSELTRVLKPGGKGIFFEPMGYHPLVNAYRKLTPSIRTDDEHPLLMEDIRLAETYFGNVVTHFFHLNSIAASFLPGDSLRRGASEVLNRIDHAIFKMAPFMKKYAWIVVLELINKSDESEK